ncbi:MAG: Coenzyme F420 hydrogenase/dehydrogenase, beta subunit C-terminal domain [Proteobacteria bacterium]|nr:4Fe-4S dicluster domain-containing protein [Desulfobacula sp.]MBU3951112.1 Coenzyme F420 hydrogenase/dehydrogenase, beta subunit C-terminal domain [Pseudomonadota bacterium]MBU4130023.1 Coenzyme F420 hydrogenase/dehydrogenase, beta subunit C-terminal domain [Pseudomonadota bacterium]
MKKTFFHLIQDVQKKGECNHCGGCVTFCSAMNYGALGLDDHGKPFYKDIDKCNECGLCYIICPQIKELDEEIKRNAQWESPLGHVISFAVTRAKDPDLVGKATDGGVVTAILNHLFDTRRIDGAIVSMSTPHGRIPWLARTSEEIMDSAGSHFGSSHGIYRFARDYATFSPSVKALGETRAMDRIAFVGTPCQINTIRKMQALGIVPSDVIPFCFGLFCSGNYSFQDKLFSELEAKYQFTYVDVIKINIKEDFIFSLASGKQVHIPVAELTGVKRVACKFCRDFSAEYADISFGGLGADHGWTTSIIRTPVGREVFRDALEKVLVSFRFEDNPKYITQAEEKIFKASRQKKEMSDQNHMARKTKGIRVIQ